MNLSPLNCSVILSPWDYDQGDDNLDQGRAAAGAGPAAGSHGTPHGGSSGDVAGTLDPSCPPTHRRSTQEGLGRPGPWEPWAPVPATLLRCGPRARAHFGPHPLPRVQ